MTAPVAGLWVTFEGGDGAGKSTQARLLQDWIQASGRRVVRTREPGGTEVGNLLRDIVLHHRGEIAPRAEALLYAADRAQHVATLVRPALDRGDVVIQDRYLDSSVAYQGAGRLLSAEAVRALSLWATEDALPDVTILLDLDPEAARARMAETERPFDRLEAEEAEFHARVRDAYLSAADDEPGRFLVVDAGRDAGRIADDIRAHVAPLLAR